MIDALKSVEHCLTGMKLFVEMLIFGGSILEKCKISYC